MREVGGERARRDSLVTGQGDRRERAHMLTSFEYAVEDEGDVEEFSNEDSAPMPHSSDTNDSGSSDSSATGGCEEKEDALEDEIGVGQHVNDTSRDMDMHMDDVSNCEVDITALEDVVGPIKVKRTMDGWLTANKPHLRLQPVLTDDSGHHLLRTRSVESVTANCQRPTRPIRVRYGRSMVSGSRQASAWLRVTHLSRSMTNRHFRALTKYRLDLSVRSDGEVCVACDARSGADGDHELPATQICPLWLD